jgi:hypothetical protein
VARSWFSLFENKPKYFRSKAQTLQPISNAYNCTPQSNSLLRLIKVLVALYIFGLSTLPSISNSPYVKPGSEYLEVFKCSFNWM